jgi:hypothetical protein
MSTGLQSGELAEDEAFRGMAALPDESEIWVANCGRPIQQ